MFNLANTYQVTLSYTVAGNATVNTKVVSGVKALTADQAARMATANFVNGKPNYTVHVAVAKLV